MRITAFRVVVVVSLAFIIMLVNNILYTAKHPAYGVDLRATVTPYPMDTAIFTNLTLESQHSPDKNLQTWFSALGEADHALLVIASGHTPDNEKVTQDFFYAHESFKTEFPKKPDDYIYNNIGKMFDLVSSAMQKMVAGQNWSVDRSSYLAIAADTYRTMKEGR